METFVFISKDGKKVTSVKAANIHEAKEKLPAGSWEWAQLTGDTHTSKKKS
jgi:hypothetical protein